MPALRDQQLAEYVTVTVNDLPVTAEDRWAVLLDGDTPISAVAPGETLISITAAPAIIVAAADLDLAAALVSDAFTEVADVSAVVLIDGRRNRRCMERAWPHERGHAGLIAHPIRLRIRTPRGADDDPLHRQVMRLPGARDHLRDGLVICQ